MVELLFMTILQFLGIFFFFFNLLCVGAKCEAQHAYPHIEIGGQRARREWFAPEIQLRASGFSSK